MSIKLMDIKLLWGKSGNQCAICGIGLTEVSSSINTPYILGEQAHIVGESENAPRGRSMLSVDERNSYSNLILLCPNHHTVIDKNENDYSVEYLHEIKYRHELRVAKALAADASRDVAGLNLFFRFVPFCSLKIYIEDFPDRVKASFFDVGYMFEIFEKSYPHIYPFSDLCLQEKFGAYICIQLEIERFISPFSTAYDKHVYDGDGINLKFMYNNFTEEQRGEIINYANDLKLRFFVAYGELIKYIKENCKGVKFDGFENQVQQQQAS